ncbi:MAG: hypothetical protein J0I43_00910 [Microbacterium sp.]|uniref:hypothetical protein n=1 Tax=Microbacterium sp. TaxID=51671 RepID=UPI001AD4558D|nr:hypothetical protein [Microbacterium sp.]MBN9175919.1 hypothetical protein [Microbacterium sp.]
MSQMPRVFSVAHARSLGVGEGRLRSRREWDRPFRGLRATAEAQWSDTAASRARAVGSDAVLCGPSALRAWGHALPAPVEDDGMLHIAVPRPGRAPRGRGIVGYSLGLDPVCVTVWRGIPLTTRARTWVDLARKLTLAQLVAVGDRLCLPEADECTLRELEVALACSPRTRGVAVAREALALIVPGAESYPESELRVAFEQAGLPRPEVNAEIRDGRHFSARVDMLFARWGVVVEYEGAHHAENLRQWRRDLTRIGELQRLGYVVERAHAGDLRDPAALIARVRVHLERRGWRPTDTH